MFCTLDYGWTCSRPVNISAGLLWSCRNGHWGRCSHTMDRQQNKQLDMCVCGLWEETQTEIWPETFNLTYSSSNNRVRVTTNHYVCCICSKCSDISEATIFKWATEWAEKQTSRKDRRDTKRLGFFAFRANARVRHRETCHRLCW